MLANAKGQEFWFGALLCSAKGQKIQVGARSAKRQENLASALLRGTKGIAIRIAPPPSTHIIPRRQRARTSGRRARSQRQRTRNSPPPRSPTGFSQFLTYLGNFARGMVAGGMRKKASAKKVSSDFTPNVGEIRWACWREGGVY